MIDRMVEKNSRKLNLLMVVASVMVLAGGIQKVWAAANVTGIDFKNTDAQSVLKITADGPVTFEKQENAQDKQVILEIKGAKLSTVARRKIDTSSFNSKVSLISPYEVQGQPDTARVVLQLKDNAAVEVTQDGNVISVVVPNGAATVVAEAPPSSAPAVAAAPPGVDAVDVLSPAVAAPSASAANSSDFDQLSKALEARETRNFSGKPVTLQVRDADVNDVLRMISEASGFNIVVGDDVKGKITLSMVDVPWDQALDVVLRTLKLGAERNNNLLRVVTLQSLTDEKQQEFKAKRAAMAIAPTITRMFGISYADPKDLMDTLKSFSSQGAGSVLVGGGSAVAAGEAGDNLFKVQLDKRTNQLIVQDTPEHMEKVSKLIQLLDTQTPQVLIESKIIEASEQFAKAIGGSIGMGGSMGMLGGSSPVVASFSGGNPLDSLIGSPGVFANGGAVATAGGATGGSTFGLSPTFNFIPGLTRLNAILSLAENDSTVKVITSPKIVVLNKENANVTQSTPVASIISTVSNGTVTRSLDIKNATVSLNVTPTVTNDGGVQLELNIQRGIPFSLDPQNTAVADRTIKTKVLVDSGSTLVIGGVYSLQTDHSSSGFPILRKIPILGVLFGSDSESTHRTELFFFITPKILNLKESGLGT
ncbi:type IV pilus secretin PilQ [Bdellovibrionota bacterium FG-1]